MTAGVSAESLHWPSHRRFPGTIHLMVLYNMLKIYWARSPVLDAEELGKEETCSAEGYDMADNMKPYKIILQELHRH